MPLGAGRGDGATRCISSPSLEGHLTMLKKPILKKEEQEVERDPRAERWAAHEKAYAIANPVKYAAKKAAGHFDKIPDSFQ